MDDKPDDAPVLFDTLSDERAAELFRLSLGLAGQRRLSLTPLNYALCFHYFSGLSQSLHESMDQRFGENGTLDHNQAVELFQRYLTPCTDVSVDGVRKGLLHIVDEVSDTVADVSASSLQRVGTLSGSIEALGCCHDLDRARHISGDILQEAMRMRSDSERLHKSLEETRSEVERLDAQLDQARRLALIDALTGLANRRAFDIELDRLLHAHQSKRRPFALILLDVDHFKLVNDRHGHVIGDKVLQQLANRLKSRTRQGDTVARYGGEEFAILLPRTGLAEAKNVADQACDHIRKLNLRRTDTGETIENVTASFGVAEASHEATANDVIHRADQALYEAKRRGRNRVVAAPCPINA